MPATAGRVRMPHNNRMTTSSSLNTHSIWQNAIGYDPYAASGDQAGAASRTADEGEGGYQQFKGLLKLASANAGEDGEVRGVWKGKPLKGGFPDPMFGFHGLGSKEVEDAVEVSSTSSEGSSDGSDDSDSSDRGEGAAASSSVSRVSRGERKRARGDEGDDESRKKRKRRKDRRKKERKKKAKKKKKKKRHRSDDDSDDDDDSRKRRHHHKKKRRNGDDSHRR